MKRFACWLVLGMVAGSCAQSPGPPSSPPLEPITAPQILKRLSDGSNAVTLVHVWATWCAPCVKEFPDVVQLAKAYRERGLNVILVSADAARERKAVSAFLVGHGVDWPTYQAVNLNDAFIKALSKKWSGGIPASLFFAPDGTLLAEWAGAHPYSAYEETVRRLLDKPKEGKPET